MKRFFRKTFLPLSAGCLACLVPASPGLAGTLSATYAVILSNSIVDLSAQGTLDWVHWGLVSATGVDRKASPAPIIGNLTPIIAAGGDGPNRFDDNFNGYSWTNGAPTASSTNSPTGVFVMGKKCGFRLNVPADATQRTLKVFLGAFAAKGQLDVSLSDNSAPAYSDSSVENVGNGPSRVYTIGFAADSTGQVLTVTYMVSAQYDPQYANVTLQAACLSDGGSPQSSASTTKVIPR